MAAYRRVHDMHVCVTVGLVGGGGTRFMTMHAVTCRLTAYSPGSAPAPTLDMSMGIFSFLLFRPDTPVSEISTYHAASAVRVSAHLSDTGRGVRSILTVCTMQQAP